MGNIVSRNTSGETKGYHRATDAHFRPDKPRDATGKSLIVLNSWLTSEALQRSVQLIDCCLVGSGRWSSRMSLIGARTSCQQSCIHADRLSDRFVTDSGESGDARPGSRDPSRHRPGPAGFDPSQRERPAGGWSLLSEGLGRCPRRASSGFHPKRQTPFRVKEEREDGVAFSAPE
jgi:hypothetical protein